MDLIDFVAKSFSGLQLQCILGGSDDSTCSVFITDAPIAYCSSCIDQHDTHTYIYIICAQTLSIFHCPAIQKPTEAPTQDPTVVALSTDYQLKH